MSSFNLGGEIAISRIGLGTNRIDEEPESAVILEAALDRGINFIDTADIYTGGTSERVIGATIGSDPRAYIATKGGYHGAEPEKIAAAIDASLVRLGRDTIDLYYLHKPHPTIPIEQSVDPIVSARADGRVRLIGLSNVSIDQIDRVRKLTPVAAVQNIYNCENQDNEDVIDYCERNSIAFVPYFPLRGAERAQKIADRLGATRTQVVIAAMLARSPVVTPIPGTRNVAHLESNLAAQNLTITSADLEALGFGSRA
ncbi:MAG: aldo/keto reductase [Solirubrobacterales bacterium]